MSEARGRVTRGLELFSLAWVVLVVLAMLIRSTYPLELEWMEGGSLHQARRVLDGEPIYAAPNLEFIPFLYTPLYPALVALGGAVFGLSYTLARLISIFACGVAALAIWKIVEGEGRSRAHRAVAVGLFFAGYIFAFRWLDLARNDATFLAFATWSLYWLRRSDRERDQATSWRPALVAGVLMALAFWTKQTASLFVIAGGLWTLRMPWRSLLAFGASIAIIDGVGVLLGQALTEGWLWTYIYELHQSHAFNRVRFTQKTWGMFLHAAPFLAALIAWRGFVLARGGSAHEEVDELRDGLRRGRAFWGLIFLAALLASALGYSTQWAEPNAFIPGVAFGAIYCALICPPEFEASRAGKIAAGLLMAQLSFALLLEPQYQPIQDRGLAGVPASYRAQDPWRTLPSADKTKRAAQLRAQLDGLGPKLWAPQRPWWSFLAGGNGHLSSMGLNDIPKKDRSDLRRGIRASLDATDGSAYEYVWIEGSLASWIWLRSTMARSYRLRERRTGDARVLPMIGFMSEAGMVRPYTAPQLLFERIRVEATPPGSTLVADFEARQLTGYEFKGAAFGRRNVPSIHSNHPAVGPIRGARLLSSAATKKGLRARGSVRGPLFDLPKAGGTLAYLAGRTGKGEGCHLWIEDELGARVELEVPPTDWGLEAVAWPIEGAWWGRRVRLVAEDADEEAALFLDHFVIEP